MFWQGINYPYKSANCEQVRTEWYRALNEIPRNLKPLEHIAMANSCIVIGGTNGNAYIRPAWKQATVRRLGSDKQLTKRAACKARKKANKIARRQAGIMPDGVKQYTMAEIAALNTGE